MNLEDGFVVNPVFSYIFYSSFGGYWGFIRDGLLLPKPVPEAVPNFAVPEVDAADGLVNGNDVGLDDLENILMFNF